MMCDMDKHDLRLRAKRFEKAYKGQLEYSIALQRAISAHCSGLDVPPDIAEQCPHLAGALDGHRASDLKQEVVVLSDRAGGQRFYIAACGAKEINIPLKSKSLKTCGEWRTYKRMRDHISIHIGGVCFPLYSEIWA